jgi:hypothetical protein
MSDAHKSFGQDMQKKTVDKFHYFQRHGVDFSGLTLTGQTDWDWDILSNDA